MPDADLVWQWWQVIHRELSADVIANSINGLRAGPVLPSHLDNALIERLPASPGAYVLHGEDDKPLLVAAASNVKLHVLSYFRLDQASDKALEYAHRVTNITWRATRGVLGAQLHAAALDGVLFGPAKRKMSSALFTWQLCLAAVPSVAIVPLPERRSSKATDSFGIFPSERKARNALLLLATTRRLCHCVLGLCRFADGDCLACPVDQRRGACTGLTDRKKQLVRVFAAMAPLRMSAWPHHGPIGIRERSDIHVVNQWQFLGTAQNEDDLYDLLENEGGAFDQRLYRLFNRTLLRLPPTEIVDLSRYGRARSRMTP